MSDKMSDVVDEMADIVDKNGYIEFGSVILHHHIHVDHVIGYKLTYSREFESYEMELIFSKTIIPACVDYPKLCYIQKTKDILIKWYMDNIEKHKTKNVLLRALDLLPLSAGSEFLKSMQTVKENFVDKKE